MFAIAHLVRDENTRRGGFSHMLGGHVLAMRSVMIRRLLIPLDGSDMAESMLYRLRFMLRQSDAAVTLLSVVDSRQQGWLTHAALAASELTSKLVEEAQSYLDGVAHKLREGGNTVSTRVEEGLVADKIIDVANEEHSSAVCMSTHGRSGIDRLMYGSVTEKVVRASDRPVLVVPSFDRTEPSGGVDRREWDFKSIVVALDGSRQAMQIIPHVAEGMRLFGSSVTLLLVLEHDASPEIEQLVDKHLAGATRLFEKAGVSPKTVVRRGDPATELLDYAPRYDHDMIMMTTHGRSGFSRWMLGSVAEKVVRRATVPVLVIRTHNDEATG